MKFSSTQIILAILATLVAVGGLLYGFFYFAILQKQVDIATVTQDVVNETEKAKHLDKNKALFESMSTKREMLDSYFLGNRDEDTVSFLVALESLASSTNVALEIETPTLVPLPKVSKKQVSSKDPSVISAGDLVDNSKWESLHLQIKIDGRWTDVLQFIELVEAMPYKTSFTQASLDAVADSNLKIKTKTWHGVLTLMVIKNK